jgi:hypothetical protein
MLFYILKLRNFVISQFEIRNIVLIILIKKKTRLNKLFITNRTPK